MKALESVDTIESTDEEQEERQQQNMQRRQRRPLSQARILSAEEELQRAAEELLAPKAPVAKAADAQPTADDSVAAAGNRCRSAGRRCPGRKPRQRRRHCRVAPVVHRVTCASAASAAAVTVMSVTRCNPHAAGGRIRFAGSGVGQSLGKLPGCSG